MTLHPWKRTLHDELPEGKMCFCRSNALIPCSFRDSKINYHIDSKQARVYHSRICQQTSFLAMAISKYGHWRGGASQDWQAPKIIYMHYNRRIQNNDKKKGVVYYTYRTWRKHMENQNKIHKPRTLSCQYQHFRDLFLKDRDVWFACSIYSCHRHRLIRHHHPLFLQVVEHNL
jgi:hypothetical protein